MTKKLSLLLFSLFFITMSYTTDNDLLKDYKKSKKDDNSSSCCDKNFCYIPGPKGKRGPKGKKGPAGSCGVNELFMTAAMMAGCGEGPIYPPYEFLSPYGGCTGIPVWSLFDPLLISNGAWGPFNVPDDLDNSKPVTVIVHLLVPSTDGPPIGNMAKLVIQIAYLTNNEIGGFNPPATGYTDTQVSANFVVIPPDTTFSSNVRHLAIPISLDPTVMIPGDWAFITIGRTPVAANEYAGSDGVGIIWLSTLSIQYSRLCS